MTSLTNENQSNTFPESFYLTVYPNPFNVKTKLIIHNAIAGDVNIQIFDLRGRQIQSNKIKIKSPLYEGQIDLGHHVSGIYFIRVENSTSVVCKKVILLK